MTEPITHAEWVAEGRRLFGEDTMQWRFVCPSCWHIASVADWKEAGAPEGAVAFDCVGRYDGHMDRPMCSKPGPCNYTGAGLFKLNPVAVRFPDGKMRRAFAFAPIEERGGGT